MASKRTVSFAPPDITEKEIALVVETLRSGWITTGPRVKAFEDAIASYTGADRAICLSSATAGLFLTLHAFGIGEGDEVITTPYTFAATANVILHVGARPLFVDVARESFLIDPKNVADALTPRTKAVIPVDFAGIPCDYTALYDVIASQKKTVPASPYLSRPLLLADAAHAFGASVCGQRAGVLADVTAFSFHAVKNVTTAEGGALTFSSSSAIDADALYERLRLLSLHGQSKDALAKMRAGSYRYSIDVPGYKANMTDVQAAMGLAQLARYEEEIVPARRRLWHLYATRLREMPRAILPFQGDDRISSAYHLFPLRIRGMDEAARDALIHALAEEGVAANVHFIPLPMHPAYRDRGYDMRAYPNAYAMYKNEVSLPLSSCHTDDDIHYVCDMLAKHIP